MMNMHCGQGLSKCGSPIFSFSFFSHVDADVPCSWRFPGGEEDVHDMTMGLDCRSPLLNRDTIGTTVI